MKKRSREINIFSMSALDLFASAMGAFILITIVLFPFFPNLGDSSKRIVEEKARLEQERAKLRQERTGLEQERAKLKQEKAKVSKTKVEDAELQREKARLEQEQVRLKQDRVKLEQEMAKLEQERARLKQESTKVPKTKNNPLEERVKALEQEVDDTSVLLGIKTTAKKFVIVVDMSGSIYQPGGQDYRQFITLSVRDMLSSFQSEIELVLVGFHALNRRTQLHFWPEHRHYFLVQKNTRNRVITTINNWMGLVDGGTPTREALTAALALDPEEIILLSDGAPSEDWRYVVDAITIQNTKKIPIHAVAVGDYVTKRNFIDFLVQLTERNGGYLVGAKPG